MSIKIKGKSSILFHKGFPFKVEIPNKATRETFKKSDEGKELVKCDNVEDMFRKLGI